MKTSPRFPKLNLPPCRHRVKRDNEGCMQVLDTQRGMWLVLTPEEWVRRHVVSYFSEHLAIPPANIAQEYPVSISGMAQRADIVVVDRTGSPVLIVECKSADVPLDEKVYAQAVRYNSVVEAPYMMITNGLRHALFKRDGQGGYLKLDEFPDMGPFF